MLIAGSNPALGTKRIGAVTQRESVSFARRKSGVRVPPAPPYQSDENGIRASLRYS